MVALGCLLPIAACWFGLGCTVLMATHVSVRQSRFDRTLASVVLPFWGLAFFTFLQTIPLPFSWLADLAPSNAAVWARALSPINGLTPTYGTISLAPELSRVEVVKWVSYGVLAWSGFIWAQGYRLRTVAMLTLGLSVTAGLLTAMHGAMNLTSVFGIYEPRIAFPRWNMGPLLNTNHLSAYLNLGYFSGLSLLLSSQQSKPTARTALLIVMTGGLATGVVLLASRGGVFVLLFGSLVTLVLGRSSKRSKRGWGWSSTPWLVGILFVATTIGFTWYRAILLKQLLEKDVAKLYVARDALALVRDFRIFGIGRGAFESVFFAYKKLPNHVTWTHPENIIIQWTTEWGIPVTLLGFAFLIAPLVRLRGWRRSTMGRVLCFNLVLLLVHNLVDFSLEVPGIAGLAAYIYGSILGSSNAIAHSAEMPTAIKRVRGHRTDSWSLARVAIGVVCVPLGVSCIFLARSRPALLSDLRSEAAHLSRQPYSTVSLGLLTGWMKRFPAEPYFPLVGGIVTSRNAPLTSLPWFNRALELAPTMGHVHLVLADTLRVAGLKAQALIEARLAAEQLPAHAGFVAVQIETTPEELLTFLPESHGGYVSYLEAVLSRLPPEAPIAEAVRSRLLEKSPCNIQSRTVRIQRLLRESKQPDSPCLEATAKQACIDSIDREIDGLAACPGGADSALLMRVEWHWYLGDRQQAVRMLEDGCMRSAGNSSCFASLASKASAIRDVETMARAIRRVLSLECKGEAACAKTWGWVASVHAQQGDNISAYAAASHAVEQDSTNLLLRDLLGDTAMRVGAWDRAIHAYSYILDHRPSDAAGMATKLASAREAASKQPSIRGPKVLSPAPSASTLQPRYRYR